MLICVGDLKYIRRDREVAGRTVREYCRSKRKKQRGSRERSSEEAGKEPVRKQVKKK